MSAFTFSALDASGKTQTGVLEADSSRHVREQLRHKGWVPLKVGEGAALQAAANDPQARSFSGGISSRGINSTQLALLTRQLATLLQSGMPLDETLNTVAAQSENQRTRLTVLSVRSRVLEGHSFADALRQHRHSFPATYCEMVYAGEQSGYLDTVLERLADYLETASDSQQQIKLAMLYPAILLGVSLLMVMGLLSYVVPQVVGVFAEQGVALPGLTQLLIASSQFMQQYGLLVVGGLIAVGILLKITIARPGSRQKIDRFLLSFPLTRRLSRANSTAQFSATLSILIRSGIPLVEAMQIVRQALSNSCLRQRLEEAIRQLKEGSSLHQALLSCELFSPMLLHMVASGEASGDLPHMLQKAAEHEQRTLDYAVQGSLKLLEPAILLFIGGLVFTIVLAILQPIFEMNQLIQ